jgi:hypothetical protein
MAIFVRTTDRIIRLPREEYQITEIVLIKRRKTAAIWVETETAEQRLLLGDFPLAEAVNVFQAIQNALRTVHTVVDARVEAHEVGG